MKDSLGYGHIKHRRVIGILNSRMLMKTKKGEHHVIFPDVMCPFPTQAIPFSDTAPRSCGFCGFSIPGLEHIPLNKGSCRLAQERGNTEPAYAFDIITNYFTRDMTIEEIEQELGYKVNIVSKEKK